MNTRLQRYHCFNGYAKEDPRGQWVDSLDALTVVETLQDEIDTLKSKIKHLNKFADELETEYSEFQDIAADWVVDEIRTRTKL